MGRADFWNPGDYNVICDRTGFKMKRSQCLKEWTGLIVRRESFEERHPQDFLRSFEDHQAVPDPRSEATNAFIETRGERITFNANRRVDSSGNTRVVAGLIKNTVNASDL
jgi:hypothetical protein